MPFFRVDDRSHMAPKVIAAGNASWGLFCRLGAWASDQLTDGFVPATIARLYGTAGELRRLVTVGLLEPVSTPAAGYLLVGFLKYNPTKEKVLEERAQAAERQRRARERAADVTRESRRDSQRESRAPRPDPTRPVPSEPDDYDNSRYLPPDPSSSSVDLRGMDPNTFDAVLLLIAEAVTVARDPQRPRGFRHGVLTNLRHERAAEISERLAAGATAFDLAALEAGGEVYARTALANLQGRPIHPIEVAQ